MTDERHEITGRTLQEAERYIDQLEGSVASAREEAENAAVRADVATGKLGNLDREARAYDKIVKALADLVRASESSGGPGISFGGYMGPVSSPALRVLNSVAERFGFQLDTVRLEKAILVRELSEQDRGELEAYRREFGELRKAAERVEQAAFPTRFR